MTRPGSATAPPSIRRVAIVGNLAVGKTSLFDRLCERSSRAVNIPGSTLTADRGVLSVGPGAAPRTFLRCCPSCTSGGGKGSCPVSCSGPVRFEPACPALDRRRQSLWQRWRSIPTEGEESGAVEIFHLFDTPGSSSLAAGSEDEMVARDLLLSGHMDAVLVVADAKNLRRCLALALQVAELGLPTVLDLNMMDEAESMGLEVDDGELARALGVPVGRTVAVENRGVRQLAELLLDAQRPDGRVQLTDELGEAVEALERLLDNPVMAPRALAILLLSGDEAAERWVVEHLGKPALAQARAVIDEAQRGYASPLRVVLSDAFHAEAARIAERVLRRRGRGPDLLVRFGEWSQRPWSGALIGLGVIVLAYYWIGAFGATFVVDQVSARLFQDYLLPACDHLVAPIPSAFVRDAIMDADFGLLPSGLFLAVGIVLPVLFCFYSFQAVLEDSGYLPRLAVLFDRIFRRLGLNGQGLIPLVLGFSCVTMAVITTRMLPSRRERLITTLLVLGLPCAPLLAVMLVILSKLPWTASATLAALVLLRLVLAGVGASRLLAGRRPDLILEIPKMRVPRLSVLLGKTVRRTWEFLREAVPVFLAASFAVFLFDRIGGLEIVARASRPLVHGWLGLPDEAVQVFIKTAIRREAGATELNLLREHFSNLQMVISLLVMTFLLPCINAIIVVLKERGILAGVAILGTVMASAVAIGAVTNVVCRGLGVTF